MPRLYALCARKSQSTAKLRYKRSLLFPPPKTRVPTRVISYRRTVTLDSLVSLVVRAACVIFPTRCTVNRDRWCETARVCHRLPRDHTQRPPSMRTFSFDPCPIVLRSFCDRRSTPGRADTRCYVVVVGRGERTERRQREREISARVREARDRLAIASRGKGTRETDAR